MEKIKISKAREFVTNLINPQLAKIIVRPTKNQSGFWFGGGNIIEVNSKLYITGRYRNFGDSRTGTNKGTRGWKLLIMSANRKNLQFEEEVAFTKDDFPKHFNILSIEGSALIKTKSGFKLFVSIESKALTYPLEIKKYQKPGTGKWIILAIEDKAIANLHPKNCKIVEQSDDIRFLHAKDPVFYDSNLNQQKLIFCSHPFNWSSASTSFYDLDQNGERKSQSFYDVVKKGTTWDVAITRVTSMIDLQLGIFANHHSQLVFYDGGECMRPLAKHQNSMIDYRGYSCEELSSAALINNGDFSTFTRLAITKPLFVSPWGLGTLRYISVLQTKDGFYAIYQCSDQTKAQPLMLNYLPLAKAKEILR